MNPTILGAISQPVNNVAQAYEARTTQLDAKRAEETRQRDNDMLKVFEFAGDGRTEEAKYYAQQKNLQIPEQIFSNADFAKGLALSGKLYGDDPVAAEKFTQAWANNQQGDFLTRLQIAQQAAGKRIDPNDREYQRKIQFELWKIQNTPQEPKVDRFSAGQDAYNEIMGSGFGDPTQADAARAEAQKYWDQEFGKQQRPSGGLMGDVPAFGTAPAIQQAVYQPQGQQPTNQPQGFPPLNIRNNNPGNMRPVGQDTGFQQFSTPMEGIDAMRQDLAVKIGGQSQAMQARFGQGYTPTLQNLIATWAPPEENNTAQYVMFVSQKTGIGPNQPLTQQDIDRLIPAMIEMEGGQQAVDYYQQPQNVTQQVTGGQAPQNNFSRSPFVNNLSGGGAGQNQQIFEQVREAISRGASPDAVYNRLRGMGIDPTPFMAR